MSYAASLVALEVGSTPLLWEMYPSFAGLERRAGTQVGKMGLR